MNEMMDCVVNDGTVERRGGKGEEENEGGADGSRSEGATLDHQRPPPLPSDAWGPTTDAGAKKVRIQYYRYDTNREKENGYV